MSQPRLLLAMLSWIASMPFLNAAQVVFPADSDWRYVIGTQEASNPIDAWRSLGFSDAAWTDGQAPFYYETGSGYTGTTDLIAVQNTATGVYLRKVFNIADPNDVASLDLAGDVDDGCIIWINGVEVGRPGVDLGEATFDALAINADPEPRPIALNVPTLGQGILQTGNNVIAVHLLNSSIGSSDMLFALTMTANAPDLDPPVLTDIAPAAGGTVTFLNQVTVTFSEPVLGVTAPDLLVNGAPAASSVVANGNSYTFFFPQPAYGTVQISFDPLHGIRDTAFPPNPFDHTAPGAGWPYQLVDMTAPVATSIQPAPGATVTALNQIRVRFSEDVVGVDVGDLQVNNAPVNNLVVISAQEYIFEFDEPPVGTVPAAWAAGHGIQDTAPIPNSFAGGGWQYNLDPNAILTTVIISEFMASNGLILDEDGDDSDWIEIYNAGAADVNLAGWSLTDDEDDLNKWRFPATNLAGGQFMLVFASGKDRREAGRELHTSYNLSAGGEYLALVRPDGSIASEFTPEYPAQVRNVSFGFAFSADFSTLIATGATVRALVPSSDALGDTWTMPGFDDSAWTGGTAGVGYDTGEVDPQEDSIPIAVEALGPAGFWRFSETSGGLPADNLGTLGDAYDGTYSGAVLYNQAGPRPPAQGGFEADNTTVRFNGSSTYVAVSADILNNITGFTMAGWVNFAAAPVSRVGLFGKNDALEFGFSTGWTLQIWTPGAGSMDVPFLNFVPNPLNSWHHIAVTGDGSTFRVYIDGVQAQSGASSGNYATSGSNFNIGGGGVFDTSGNFFNGLIDEVVVYRRALSPEEVLAHVQSSGGSSSDYTTAIGLDVETAMRNVNSSIYLRFPFQIAEPSLVDRLVAGVRYDDGYVMYLNGTEVSRANAPTVPAWNAAATDRHPDPRALQFQEVDLSAAASLLVAGPNVLAVQGLNIDAANSDFLLDATLDATSVGMISTNQRYFVTPSPLNFNGLGQEDLGPIISEVAHQPQVPADTDDLIITARVAPTFGTPITSFQLHYRIMFGPVVNLSMADDGLHGDGALGDGVFGAIIPASASTQGQMIRYHLSASDLNGATSRWPVFDPAVVGPDGGLGDYEEFLGTMVQDPTLQSKLPIFNLFVEPTEWSRIDATARPRTGGRVSIFHDGELYDNVRMGVRGNTTAGYTKKSHHLEFPREHRLRHPGPGDRVRDTSFVADFPDPSYMRQGLSFWLADQMGAPAPFYYPVLLMTNGVFYQLANHQIMIRPEITRYLGYDDRGALYQAVGTAQTSQFSTGIFRPRNQPEGNNTDYQQLAAAIAESQSLANRRNAVFDMFDVPEMLNYLVTARWVHENDDVWANMSLYRDTFGDRLWRAIPFDMNLSWGAIFYEGGNPTVIEGVQATNDNHKAHPFYGGSEVLAINSGNYNRVYDAFFDIPETREMYLRRMRTMLDTWFKPPGTSPYLLPVEQRIRDLQELMREEANRDRQKWGWPGKGGQSNFDPGIPFDQGVDDLINLFIGERRYHFYVRHSIGNTSFPIGVLENQNAGIPLAQPTDAVIDIAGLEYNPPSGNQNEEYLCLTNANPFAVDISGWQLDGGVEFTFKPGTVMPSNSVLYVSPDLNAFRARVIGPRGGQGLFVVGGYNGQLSARGESIELYDQTGRAVSTNTYAGTPNAAQQYLRITEIMYNPSPLLGSPFMADYPFEQNFEYIELKNIGPSPLSLAGVRFINGIDFALPDTILGPDETILVAKNVAAFNARYGAGLNVTGSYAALLDNGGERLRLVAADGEEILDFSYNDAWYPITDGLGFSLVVVDEDAEPDAWNQSSQWRPSGTIDGTPGASDPGAPVLAPIVVNEILTHTDPPQLDAVEFYNPTPGPVDLGGWFLSDDFGDPMKYRIPNGTMVAGLGYLTLDEDDFNPTPGVPPSFTFSSKGEEVYLFSGDPAGSELTGYFDGFDFGASANGVSFARHVNSVTNVDVVARAALTFNAPNAGPRIGPVVVSEIHFHPPDVNGQDIDLDEFIELHNTGGSTVGLFETGNPTNAWQLVNAVEFTFPPAVTMNPGEYLIVVGFDPMADPAALAAFRQRFGVDPAVQVHGPWQGKLDNSAERVDLRFGDTPEVGPIELPLVRIEKIEYEDEAPWDEAADGYGASLQRLDESAYANDPAHWRAAAPTPGGGLGNDTAPSIVQSPQDLSLVLLMDGMLSVSATGEAPLSYQWILNGDALEGATGSILLLEDVEFSDVGTYQVLVFNRSGAALSAPAQVDVLVPAVIYGQPQPVAVGQGSNTVLRVEVNGSGLVQYQWRLNGVPLPGANDSILEILDAQAEDDGIYDVVVTDSISTVISNPVRVTVLIRPAFDKINPMYYVVEGGSVTMSVEVSGTLPMTYRWRKGFATLELVTLNSGRSFHRLENVTTNDGGPAIRYSVVATNQAFFTPGVLSPNFFLTVLPDADQDGLPDAWEADHGVDDPNGDADMDGVSNGDEYESGTDPNDENSYLRIDRVSLSGGVNLEFMAASNTTYKVEYKNTLEELVWETLSGVVACPSNRTVIVTDPVSNDTRVYRLAAPWLQNP